MRPLPARPVHVREARTSRAAASSDAEKIAGQIVEYGAAVEDPSGPRSTITPQRHPASLRVRCPRTGPGGVVDFAASADRDPLPDSRLKLPAPCRLW
jgi:hypothetical protein